jgi:nicotinamide mononucleotide transporter
LADALTTVLSVEAQYLMTRKVIEHWLVWMAADVIYIWLYAERGLYLTSLLYVVFFVMCVAGWRDWLRDISHQRAAAA